MTANRRTDAALAAGTLAVFLGASILVEASVSLSFAVLGAVGTIGFEAVAVQRARAIRRYWERPAVQAVTFLLAVGIAVAGALTAPTAVLSAGVGALVTYLCLLGVLETRERTDRRS